MGEVIRRLDPDSERGVYIPQREITDWDDAEANIAVMTFVARCINEGITQESGFLLVQLDGGLQIESPYGVYIDNSPEAA